MRSTVGSSHSLERYRDTSDESPNNELDERSALVRELYCEAVRGWLAEHRGVYNSDYGRYPMPSLDGGYRKSDGHTFQSVWPKLTAFLVDNGLDPKPYITKVFLDYKGSEHPSVSYLQSTAALKRYVRSGGGPEAQAEECQQELSNQLLRMKTEVILRMGYIKQGVTEVDIVRSVLQDIYLPLSALLRYCVAVRYGLHDLAEALEDRARRQYSSKNTAYDAGWIDWIPDALKNQ